MTGITLAHHFVSAKGDGVDTTLIQPSNWNAQHDLHLDANNLIGRLSAGNGAAEQIPLSAFMATLLAAADAGALAGLIGVHSTGDGKLTLKTTADAGWLMFDDGTFGNAGSGSSNRANADCQALFTLIYNNISDTAAPVLTSAGGASTRAGQGSAATAWAAACRLSLPKQLGRAFVAAGAGSGLTARALGSAFGEESHLLLTAELPSHTHANSLTDPGHTHPYTPVINLNIYGGGGGVGSQAQGFNSGTTGSSTTGITLTNAAAGGGGTHNNTQASTGWNVMVKL